MFSMVGRGLTKELYLWNDCSPGLISSSVKMKLPLGEGQIEVSRLSFETNRAP
jgi:hypothetical protein